MNQPNNNITSNAYHLQNITKSYGSKAVLDINDFTISSGIITALIGPSGSGKSTLLRLLNCLEAPDSGSMNILGLDLPANSTKIDITMRRRMAMVLQKPVLFNSSVFDNVAYGLKIRKIPETQIRKSVIDMLEFVGLADKSERHAKTLSGGEAQRASLARALVINPDILLLDEPTANLDPANVLAIEDLVKKAKQAWSTTIVIVTHNMFQAKRLADRAALLLDGSVIEYSDADSFFNSPQDDRTLSFIKGEMIY